MDQKSERTQRELKARITELAAGLLQAIAGGGSLHQLPRQIEDAARAVRKHVAAGGSASRLIAQALNIEDAVVIAERLRSVMSCDDEERATIETLHEYAIEVVRTGAVREAAAVLEGNRIKRNRARQQVLFAVNALIEARALRLELLGPERRQPLH
jgi:hypothetical protein